MKKKKMIIKKLLVFSLILLGVITTLCITTKAYTYDNYILCFDWVGGSNLTNLGDYDDEFAIDWSQNPYYINEGVSYRIFGIGTFESTSGADQIYYKNSSDNWFIVYENLNGSNTWNTTGGNYRYLYHIYIDYSRTVDEINWTLNWFDIHGTMTNVRYKPVVTFTEMSNNTLPFNNMNAFYCIPDYGAEDDVYYPIVENGLPYTFPYNLPLEFKFYNAQVGYNLLIYNGIDLLISLAPGTYSDLYEFTTSTSLGFSYQPIETTAETVNINFSQRSDSEINISGTNYTYSLNNGIRLIIANDNVILPYSFTATNEDSIEFYNNSDYTNLNVYINNILYETLEPGQQMQSYYLSNDVDISFSADLLEQETYIITGGYKFNDNFSFYTSDLDNFFFTNYFEFPYGFLTPGFINFTGIKFQERTSVYTASMRYMYNNGSNSISAWTDYNYTGLGYWYQYNDPVIYTQFIKFDNLQVSADVYDWLISNGNFGEYDLTDLPNNPSIDGSIISDFLVDSLNGFLSFELMPGFSLFSLLSLIIAIPLLIYILKLFLGG